MRALLIAFLCSPTWLGAQEAQKQPSLVELVRLDKARKKGPKKRAITNADLRRFRKARVTTGDAPPPTLSPAKESSEAELEGTQSESESEAKKDIEFWKSALREAQLDVTNVINRGRVLQLKMNHLRNAFLIEDDGSTQALLQGQLSQTLQEINQNKLETEEVQKTLAAIEREARIAGVPLRVIQDLTSSDPQATEIAPF